MTDPLTPDDLAAIKARYLVFRGRHESQGDDPTSEFVDYIHAMASFMVDDVPRLFSTVEEQAAALERLRGCIETTIGNLDQPEPVIDWVVMELRALLDEPGEQG